MIRRPPSVLFPVSEVAPIARSASRFRPGPAAPFVPLFFAVPLLLGLSPISPAPASGRAASAAPAAIGYAEALRLYRAGRLDEALALIAQRLARHDEAAPLHALAGWIHLRRGSLDEADSEFGAALLLEPASLDPIVGRGYIMLRRGAPAGAQAQFEGVLRRDPGNVDALKGLGIAQRDRSRPADAADSFRKALTIAPADAEAKHLLEQALAVGGSIKESRPRPPLPPDAPIEIVARAGAGRLEIAADGRFKPIFIKGVNMGVALPGRFPAEFPDDEATYAGWLDAISDLGANVIRLYTLLPPAFYNALDRHNKKMGQAGRLWLLQGVWTELPERHAYDDPAFLAGFDGEIRRVVDALHGNLDLPSRPGHASGAYRADLSSSLLGFILGREWEPFSVQAFDQAHRADRTPFRGRYFGADPAAGATPFEGWLARRMDLVVSYETAQYRRQRPVSFVNWPTLDPLVHPTESTVVEEKELLRKRGDRVEADRINEYDNDGVSVDATHIVATPEARGGSFATYHAYPYYPDFMNLDPGYSRARDAAGPSNYAGYLRDLKAHHGAQPIVIAELGVPSSRGIAHLQAQGWNHGGHDEREQGEIDARLMRDVDEAGLAGGVLFALLDEWFKRNWLVADLETPAERNPLWLNVLDPEQNYGLLAARPGAKGWKVTIDGRGDDWATVAPLMKKAGGPVDALRDGHDAARTLRSLSVTSDEAYLYLRLEVENLDADGDGRPDWNEATYMIGIDTYDPRRGDRRLPIAGGATVPIGAEFCVVFDGETTSRLLVDPPYDVETHRYHRPYGSVGNDDGRFMEIEVETNRKRIGRDGTVYPARRYSRSPLRHGSIDPRDPGQTTLADWHASVDGHFIEARLGWGLLNVTDPSSHRVLQDDQNDLRSIGTVETKGFRFYALALRPGGPPGGATPLPGQLADRLPAGEAASLADFPVYSWPGWEQPTWRIEKKEAWSIVKRAFETIPAHAESK